MKAVVNYTMSPLFEMGKNNHSTFSAFRDQKSALQSSDVAHAGLSSWNLLTDDVRWQGRHAHLFALRYGHKPTLWCRAELHTVQVRRSASSAPGALAVAHNDHNLPIWMARSGRAKSPCASTFWLRCISPVWTWDSVTLRAKKVGEQAPVFGIYLVVHTLHAVLELRLQFLSVDHLLQVSIKMKIAAPNASVAALAPIRRLLQRRWRCLVVLSNGICGGPLASRSFQVVMCSPISTCRLTIDVRKAHD